MANEMFSSLPDVMTAEQLASALQISKSGAYALLNRSDFPTLRIGGRKMVMKADRGTENGDEKGSDGMAEQPHQQTPMKIRS